MALTRSLACLRLLNNSKLIPGRAQLQQTIRHHGDWHYRTGCTVRRKNVIIAECLGAFMWWWVIHHLITEPGHIFGEWPYPDASKWTDAELGIPSDDAE